MTTLETPRLKPQDYKTLALAALGGALEFYDFIIFVFSPPLSVNSSFPPISPTGFVSYRRSPFCRGLSGASAWWHHHGALWRQSGP